MFSTQICEPFTNSCASPVPPQVDDKSIESIAGLVRGRNTTSEIPCRAARTTVNDSAHHTTWFVHFEDGVEWVVRAPHIGHSPILEERIKSDICGIQLIQSETKIPIPSIIDFSTSSENPLGRPYVITERPRGVPLSDLWCHPEGISDEIKRKAVFKSLASTFSQLKAIEFDKIGSLYFDNASGTYTVGPTIPSYEEIADGYITARGTYPTTHTYLLGEIRRQMSTNTDEDRKLFLALLRVFAGFIPDHHFDEQPFVLSSPKIELHSIFVDDDGHVTAITEWDSIFVGPREGGYAKYPSWITLDWDPIIDRYPTQKIEYNPYADWGLTSTSESEPDEDNEDKASREGDADEPLDNDEDKIPKISSDAAELQRESSSDVVDVEVDEPSPHIPLNTSIPTLNTSIPTVGVSLEVVDGVESVHNGPESLHLSNEQIPTDSPIPAILDALRQEYLEAFTEVDPDGARFTRFSHIFNALEGAALSSKPGPHILHRFKEFLFGPFTTEQDGYLLEVPVLLKRLSMAKWINDLMD